MESGWMESGWMENGWMESRGMEWKRRRKGAIVSLHLLIYQDASYLPL